ncbi:MAG: T9SS type A sorting domain-containing protein, partial [Chitinophagales bacterium]
TNLDIHTYDALNGGWVFRKFNERNYPFIYAVNGKYDTLMGWTEKTVYYDSVNATHTGGYYFWDSRNHGGTGATWGEMNFDLFRYRRNLSYPAFANCSINEDYGNGLASDGAAFGTVNGFLDWKNEITDVADSWSATIFLRDLLKEDGNVYESPEQCTVDVTLRRLQNFHPAAGETLSWNLWHKLDRIQSGSFVYGGGLATIPQISVYKDSVRLEIIRGESTETDVPSTLDIYPNPARQDATIRFNLQDAQQCEVKIYNEQGSLISVLKNEFMSAGTYQLVWNIQNSSIGSGLYFVTLQTANERITGKLAVIK